MFPTASAMAQVQVQFTQSSNPAGLFTSSSSLVNTGSVATTIVAPTPISGYQFAYWTFNGVRQQDAQGLGINPASAVATAPITAVAQYILTSADTDADGVPDWWEYWTSGTLSNSPTSDTDGDGFTMLTEYQRDYSPNLVDTMVNGGVARRASAVVTFVSAGYASYQEISSPLGFLNNQYMLVTNTLRILPDVTTNAQASGYQFEQWVVNGVRVADALGRSVGGLPVLVLSNTTAVAVFYPSSQDTVGDGVPDWFKMLFYGTLTNGAASDTDGDGFTLADEYLRDYSPTIVDTDINGGIGRRGSPVTYFLNPGYTTYQEVSNPGSFLSNQFVVATNTVRFLPDVTTNGTLAGYQFGQWQVNGVRVADALGRSVGGLPVVVTTDTVAVATFYLSAQDTAADGVPDWYKVMNYGTISNGAASDLDGDGFTLLEEYNYDYNPVLRDTIQNGGVSRRAVLVTFSKPYVSFAFNSVPAGVLDISGLAPQGTNVLSPDLRSGTNGYVFGHWTMSSLRQVDGQGYPVSQVSLAMVNNNNTATAYFYLPADDSNGNGIPDWWEDYYFGGATGAVATADGDRDGMNNFQEYVAGTNPRDGTSRLAITQFHLATNGWLVGFQSVSGIVYRAEFAPLLANTNTWQTLLDNINGDGTFLQVIDPTASGATQRFYRITVPH